MSWADVKCRLPARLGKKKSLFAFKYAAYTKYFNCFFFSASFFSTFSTRCGLTMQT